MRLGFQIAVWIILGVVVVMTIGPIGLRPSPHLPVNFQRFAAFVVLGACFMIAYPEHSVVVLICLIAGGGALELAQTIVPGRHGRVDDFAVKLAGLVAGICLVQASRLMISRI